MRTNKNGFPILGNTLFNPESFRMCMGKRKYDFEYVASSVCERMKSQLHDASDLHVYLCPVCGAYHIGHGNRGPNARKVKQA